MHGPDHDQTKKGEAILHQCQQRIVGIGDGRGRSLFQVLRFVDDGAKYVVKGPFVNESFKNVEKETVLTLETSSLNFTQGTPVVCHGLENAVHLNGKIGDLRGFYASNNQYKVCFEDKKLKPVQVKRSNIRIVFDLPDAKQG